MGRRMPVRVVAQDPGLRDGDDNIVTAVVTIPEEVLDAGPRGTRVAVVDYDSTRRVHYEPWRGAPGTDLDRELTNRDILDRPCFHALNAFALVMRTVARFERALGRRVGWGFDGTQLNIVPHAFEDANAYYSPSEAALLFGYFPSPAGWIYTSLSHDIVVHETAHALLHGTRSRYLDLAHPDQAGFHEGFADVISLLSTFTMGEVVGRALLALDTHVDRELRLLDRNALRVETVGAMVLTGLADQLGTAFTSLQGQPLRRSLDVVRHAAIDRIDDAGGEIGQPHRRGDLLVAAVMSTFLAAWLERLEQAGDGKGPVSIGQAAHEAHEIAEALLDVVIKALDYAPPIDLQLGDYLSALLTSDREVRPDDTLYRLRAHALHRFRQLGIEPTGPEPGGLWSRPQADSLRYVEDSPIESSQHNPEDVLRFLWQNRRELGLEEDAYTHVVSARPSLHVGSDGFAVRETVVEYKQSLYATPADCRARLPLPDRLAPETVLKLKGGGVLVFDENGRLKYHVYQRLFGDRQVERLRVLWDLGLIDPEGRTVPLSIAALHAQRSEMTRDGW
jgi:hypothetical protein